MQGPRRSAGCAAKLNTSWEKPLPLFVSVVWSGMTACHKILSSVKDEIASTFQSFNGMMDRMQGPSMSLSRTASMPSLSEPIQEDREPRSLASSQTDSGSDSIRRG